MLAVFGCMVGFYIITRMMELISARQDRPKLGFTGFFAFLTIFVTLGAMAYFVFGPDLMKAVVGLK